MYLVDTHNAFELLKMFHISDQFVDESVNDASSYSGLGYLTAVYRMKVLLFDLGPNIHTVLLLFLLQ